ncbi:MAG: thiamine pyrophosphate-dependent enzyme, partial [bacterium]
QNEQDNRHFAYLSYTPLFEPTDPTEVYQFYLKAAALSREKGMPVILRLTTHVCHQKERVTFGDYEPLTPDRSPRFDVQNGPYIPIASLVFPQKQRALENLQAVREWAERSDINRIVDHGNTKRGIITSGLPFSSLLDVLENARVKPDVLKLGLAYPVALDTVRQFLDAHEEVKILEELDDQMEKQIKAMAYDAKLRTRIIGKTDLDDWMGEYTPGKIYQVLVKIWPDLLPAKKIATADKPHAPARPAQLCPGCGHRSAFHAVKKALAETDITVADIGCHTLGFQPPYNMGQLLMCMGSATSIGAGLSLFNTTRKVVVFMGDSTFFHAALPGVVNALFNRHNLTMVLMENGTTAMTGHQDHAASGKNFNDVTDAIPIRSVLEGFGVRHIHEADAYRMDKIEQMVRQAVDEEGFSVVIAKHPCMLKQTREKRQKGSYAQRHVAIDQATCERINECIEVFACPTFTRLPDGSVVVNEELCIGDGSCIKTCPASAIGYPKLNP